jgi:hypothetical protein
MEAHFPVRIRGEPVLCEFVEEGRYEEGDPEVRAVLCDPLQRAGVADVTAETLAREDVT